MISVEATASMEELEGALRSIPLMRASSAMRHRLASTKAASHACFASSTPGSELFWSVNTSVTFLLLLMLLKKRVEEERKGGGLCVGGGRGAGVVASWVLGRSGCFVAVAGQVCECAWWRLSTWFGLPG